MEKKILEDVTEKLRKLVIIYRGKFVELRVGKKEFPNDKYIHSPQGGLAHCHYLLDVIETELKKGGIANILKASLYMGNIQYALLVEGAYTIAQVKKHGE